MILKCFINGKEYKIVQGATFAEEYNETLDSGTIIITHVEKIEDLKPYDDVFIYEGEFKGYGPNVTYDGFYKHLLVDQYNEERLNPVENIYSYKIQLFSETKKLETIQLPNISITQPLDINKKKTVFNYLDSFVDLYSPVKKVAINNENWLYQQKYTLDQSLSAVFSDIYAPDFTLNAPSLKDLIAQLMLTRDKIPYVKDDVIYALDITERKKDFDLNGVTSITGSMTSDDYCNNLKRNYSNALTQDFSCNMIEYLGFRNSDTPLLTLENLRLETSFPIYKINKIYLCYYKKGKVFKISDVNNENAISEKAFLCKQDITPLVLLNETRNLLSQDWDDFDDEAPKTIEELANYKLATVGYDIGSKYITGWGTKYSYPVGWWKTDERTYIENIISWMDNKYPYGIYNENYVKNFLQEDEIFLLGSSNSLDIDEFLENMFSPIYKDDNVEKEITGSAKMKFLFFQVEYDAFYNGAIVHSKDNLLDDITINDNSSASLTLIDKDGLFQKEKINRFGNKGYIIKARVDDYKKLNNLGDIYDDDVIIYHREYQIWDDYILVDYYGTKDYVLKNYFTTVFARYRNYNLMSYNESINRAENKKVFLLLSTNKCYYEDDLEVIQFKNFDNENPIRQLLSFFKPSEKYDIKGLSKTPEKINYGYYTYDGDYFASDINTFTSGNSLCINLKMYDNVTGGVYIKNPRPSKVAQDVKEDLIGSIQSWHMSSNEETGRSEKMGFYCGHVDKNSYFEDKILDEDEFYEIKNNIYKKLLNLPLLDSSDKNLINMKNIIGKDYKFLKDNKEIIDMTFQIEALTQNNDILFSQWMLKLSDLLGIFNKVNKKYIIYENFLNRYSGLIKTTFFNEIPISGSIYGNSFNTYKNFDMSVFEIHLEEKIFEFLEADFVLTNFNIVCDFDNSTFGEGGGLFEGKRIINYMFKGKKIAAITPDYISVIGDEYITTRNGSKNGLFKKEQNFVNEDRKLTFFFFEKDEEKQILKFTTFLKMDYALKCFPGNEFFIQNNGSIEYIKDFSAGPTNNEEISNFTFNGPNKEATHEYKQNLFFTVSNEEMKKTIIYEELKDLSQKDGLEIYGDNISPIELTSDKNNLPILRINCISQQIKDKKNFSVWYKIDNSYKFVFGVNLKEELKTHGNPVEESIKIYYEFTDSDYNSDSGMYTRIFEYFIPGAMSEGYDYGPHLTYNVEGQGSLVSNFNFKDKTNIVNFTLTSKDKIVFDAQLNYISREVYIPIYLSLVSNRDTRVYDMNNKKVGNNFNYTELVNNQPEETDVFWGELQYFKKDTDDDIYYENKGLSYNLNSENKYVVKSIGNCKDKYIIIPKKHKEIDVVSIDNNAFENSDLYYIEIPENIINIGESAFKDCIYLKKIVLPDSVEVIEKSIFENCYNLKNITLSENITEIKENAFKNCSKVSLLDLPKNISKIGKNAFENCYALTEIYYKNDLKNWLNIIFENEYSNPMSYSQNFYLKNGDVWENLINVTIPNDIKKIGSYQFYNIKTIEKITMSDNIIEIGDGAFKNCTNLKSLTLPEGITEVNESLFSGCDNLEEIVLPSTIKTIGKKAFNKNYNLKNIFFNGTISDWCNIDFADNLSNPVTENFYMKNGDGDWEQLTSLFIPGDITEIKKYQFYRFKNLKSVVISESVYKIDESAFAFCKNLEYVYIPDNVLLMGERIFNFANKELIIYCAHSKKPSGWNDNWNPDNLKVIWGYYGELEYVVNESYDYLVSGLGDYISNDIVFPETYYSNAVVGVKSGAFKDEKEITSVTIPGTFKEFQYEAFYNCTSLKTVYYNGTVEDWCNIEFGAFGNPMYYADDFYMLDEKNKYYKVEEITIPNTIKRIEMYQFDGFDNLKKINIHNTLISVESYAFQNCKGLTEIFIPKSVKEISGYAFIGCENLTIYCEMEEPTDGVPDDWSKNWNFDNRPVVWGCKSLIYNLKDDDTYEVIGLVSDTNVDVIIPLYYKEKAVTSIKNSAFINKTKIEKITFNSKNLLIGENAFNGCENLKSIIVFGEISKICQNAFKGCINLDKVYFNNSLNNEYEEEIEKWCNIIFENEYSNPMYYATKFYLYYSGVDGGFKEITNLQIPTTVTSINDYQFYGFDNLKEITLTTFLTTLGANSFNSCVNLTNIYIPYSVVEIGENAFKNCSNLTIYSEQSSKLDTWSENWNPDDRPVVWSPVANMDLTLKDDGTYEIKGLGNYTNKNVIIPNKVNEIEVTSIGNNAFKDNIEIISVDIPDTVTNIGEYSFSGCSGLRTLTIGKMVNKIDKFAFSGNLGLKTVCYNGTVEDWCNINIYNSSANPMMYADEFYMLNNNNEYEIVTTINIPESITSIGKAQFYGFNITSINLPESILTIGNKAFAETSLTGINIPSSVTNIDNEAFYSSDIKSLTFADGSNLVSIGDGAFKSCSKLHSNTTLAAIKLPEKLENIGLETFYGCTNMKVIVIPSSVSTIGLNAFKGCSSLQIKCKASSKPSGWNDSWNPDNRPVSWNYLN